MESHSTDLPDKPFGLVDMADFLEKKKKIKIYKPKLLQLAFFFSLDKYMYTAFLWTCLVQISMNFMPTFR